MHVYLGIFLISLTTLTIEIAMTRILSVISWYYLAFFAVSTAMLGMTAGAVTVYLRPDWFKAERLDINISKICLACSLAIPISLILLCMLPFILAVSIMSIFVMIMVTLACMLPFYFSGIVITSALTKYKFSIGKLYASNLLGSACGCLFALVGLEMTDAASLILACAAVSILAAFSFASNIASFKLHTIAKGYLIGLIFLVLINSYTSFGIRPFVIKGHVANPRNYLLEKWNLLSRVVVSKAPHNNPSYWGASPFAPKDKKVFTCFMNIDGAAGTPLNKFFSREDIDYLSFDITNAVYYLRPKGSACIIGVGGGRDIQSAILFGHEKITGIDINPIFINLLKNRFRKFAGIADRKEVTFVTNEARSFLSFNKEKYSVIQMSLVDTWAASAAGAFSLSENALYTIQAWKIFLSRLKDDGIFTVSRWYSPENLGETGRIVSLAVGTLIDSKEAAPKEHIAMVTTDKLSTLLISKQPFSRDDIEKLKNFSSKLGFNLVISPDRTPENEILRSIISANSWQQLNKAIKDRPLNYTPPTDENPYFFNMLKLNKISNLYSNGKFGLERGNLIATVTLFILILILLSLAIMTIILPLWLKLDLNCSQTKVFWPAAIYFLLIGAGFMFTEIALVQKLSVFLGHPMYALGIILFTIIASAGTGSLFSSKLPLTKKPWVFIYPFIIAGAIATVCFVLRSLESQMVSATMLAKILTSIIILIPVGFLLGLAFPTGMQLVESSKASETPWYWALNGIFSVLCSALAVFVAVNFGISTNFYIASSCYMLLLCFLPHIYRASGNCK
jgi:SAM-dependent methyltransferase